MKEIDIQELHRLMCNFLDERNYKTADMLSFLTSNFVGTLAMAGITDEFAKQTFDMMFEKFKEHPLRKMDFEERIAYNLENQRKKD